ncbi:hypothetical protein [Xanthomonas phage OP2]|uniref:Uncharacterized protein n=1 Tax=Xanthomonas phage OP2 TaxID=331627 RepID=Q2NP87_9CAUD|nr:hypothetical protein OP2_ORF45 [Xanthomonas phage OP2]BAE72809.1 hypothetical protein [Xanthomonas phage OP2]
MKTMTKTIAFACAALMSFTAGAREISQDEVNYLLTTNTWDVFMAPDVSIDLTTVLVVNHHISAWYRSSTETNGTGYMEIVINCRSQQYAILNIVLGSGEVLPGEGKLKTPNPDSQLAKANAVLCRVFDK